MRALPAYLRERRWFRSKARRIKNVSVRDVIHVSIERPARPRQRTAWPSSTSSYTEGEPESYAAAAVPGPREDVDRIVAQAPQALIDT